MQIELYEEICFLFVAEFVDSAFQFVFVSLGEKMQNQSRIYLFLKVIHDYLSH